MGVLFVNGWSDAPNAIATCISTKAMRPQSALIMAAICNFAGLLIMFFVSTSVAKTIQGMISFNGTWGDYTLNSTEAQVALKVISSAMMAVITFSVIASIFGIPSSETHALIGGLIGAGLSAMLLGDSEILINTGFGFFDPLGKIVYGLFLSCI